MYANAGERTRWSVVWVAKGKVVRRDFGTDYPEALRIYSLCVKADKKAATLFSCNMSIPPPEKYADTEQVIVTRNGKRYKTTQAIVPHQFRVTMHRLNLKGVYWCCFCAKPRKFVKVNGTARVDGKWVGEPVLTCPLCGVGHTHGSIVKYNPLAARGAGRKERSDKGKRRVI